MRFCFYSGYRDLKGGYTTLVLTLIKELYRMKQEVVLINFAQGLIADELKKENVEINIIDLDTINWEQIHTKIFPTDIFIITRFAEEYRHLLKVDPKVVYYDINDFIGQISDYKFGLKFPSLGKKLVGSLLEKRSLVFMDDTGIFNLKEHFSIAVKDPVFLPIPVKVNPENIFLKRQSLLQGTLHLTYIGRSVNWKMMPLKRILNDCAASRLKKNIHITIVVDDLSGFHKYINIEEYVNSVNLSISVIESMLPSAINDFLLNNADLHFAMGTAALDAAKIGIPTILVDYATKEFPDNYKYKWLFETKGFSLGRNLDKMPQDDGIIMDELLTITAANKEKLAQLSNTSYEYVVNNHSDEKIVTRLIDICRNATFRLRDAKNLIPYYFPTHRYLKNLTGIVKK